MRVLLTGISGFIARRIALDLLQSGHSVRGSLRSMARADEVRASLPRNAHGRLDLVELTLDRDEGWTAAARGMDAIVHTASPFPMRQRVDDPDSIIRPAVQGTRRALRAARDANISRVVVTSSTVAITNGPDPVGRPRDERDWSTPDHPNANAYVVSKMEAERVAWADADRYALALTTINPGLVLGPPLGHERNTSLNLVERLLSGRDRLVPPITFEAVDVRDVSRAHIAALERPASIGRRYATVSGLVSLVELARIAKSEAPDRRIATQTAPAWVIRLLARRDPDLKAIVPILKRVTPISGDRARAELGLDYIPAADAARATVRALLADGA